MGAFKKKLIYFLNVSRMLFLEKHKEFYNEHKLISLIIIIVDAMFINPFRKLRLKYQENQLNKEGIEKLVDIEKDRPIEFLLFGVGELQLENKQYENNTKINFFKYDNNSYSAEGLVNQKFSNDKCFIDNEKYTILFDGVIFNLSEILKKYNKKSIFELAVKILNDNNCNIINELRGEFSGILYDKENNIVKFFVDHFSMKKMYYYHSNSLTIISTNFDVLQKALVKNGIKTSLSKTAAYMLLTHGYMAENNTIINQVEKIEGGFIGIIDKNKLALDRYYKINNQTKTKQSYEEIIENVDYFFKNAIRRQFDKNLEYGYKQICTLSGGLDSRMVCVVASELGYNDIKTITFGQSDTWDQKIAHDISIDFGFDWDFFPLNDANHLFNLQYGLRISGQTIYSETSKGANYFYENNNEEYGLIHTGQAGDVILSYFGVKSNIDNTLTLLDTVASKMFINKVSDNILKRQYINQEELLLTQRVFNSTFYGNADYEQGRFSYSPFMDVDFFNYCMSIPVEFRKNHKIYKDWIIKKYPKAANYKWEKTNNYIIENIEMKKSDRFKPKYYSMNPHDSWYYSNPKLRVFLKSTFNKMINSEILKSCHDLRHDLKYMFENGTVREKLQVITVLGLIDRYKY